MATSDPSIDLELAESGVALALARDLASCCELLLERVLRAPGVARAGVRLQLLCESHACGEPLDGAEDPCTLTDASDRWAIEVRTVTTDAGDHAGGRAVVELLVRQAAVGLQWLAERSDLARAQEQQEALVESGKALSSERGLDGVLQLIVEHAMSITGARYGALGVLEAGRRELARFVTAGIDEETHARIGELPTGRGILGVLIDDPRPLRLARLQDDPRSVGFPEHHPPMSTFLGVPIITSGAVAGRIYLTEKAGGTAFTADDERLVQVLASQAAIAIDNAALNERLQRTAAALAEASRHKSAFMANMSHELRSPLNTIIGYTRLLLDDPRGLDEEQLEDLAIVRGSGEHLLALITDLLDLQKIEAGRVTLVLGDEQLRPILEAVVASVRPTVPEGVELVLDSSGLDDDSLHCDRTRIRQVLLNVIGNALKFTSEGEVRLVARGDEHWIRLVVSDTGPGIPAADRPRIFESFYQSTQALGRTPSPREGAGLGLAITKLLVELHGGEVRLDSQEGEGTQVTIRIPRSGPESGGRS
jgi:signal transduction histidine kinase